MSDGDREAGTERERERGRKSERETPHAKSKETRLRLLHEGAAHMKELSVEPHAHWQTSQAGKTIGPILLMPESGLPRLQVFFDADCG